jgi:hypothetical protein
VEGAQAPEVLVALGQTDVLLDDLDQVDLGLDLGQGFLTCFDDWLATA